jgi:outer membrane protein TolC
MKRVTRTLGRLVCVGLATIVPAMTVSPPAFAQQPAASESAARVPADQRPVVGGGVGTTRPFSGVLSLTEAIERGIAFNIRGIGLANAVRRAEGQESVAKSLLLPNISGTVSESLQKINLAALGVQFDIPIPGFTLPETVGPYYVFDMRARLSQTVLDRSALNNHRAAQEAVQAGVHSVDDIREVIVLAVGSAYLQAVAARAHLQSARAQVDLATTLFNRAMQQRGAGLATPIDVNRAQVQTLSQQQRMLSLQADFAKQKIDLARMTGLPATDKYDLAAEVAFAAAPAIGVEDALRQAAERRSDLKAAEAQVRAAEHAVASARDQRLPTVAVNGDFGGSYSSPTPLVSTYSLAGLLRIPIWEGKRIDGETRQANATLAQRRAERDDLRAEIEGDVRKTYLNLEAAARLVEVAEMNVKINRDNLALTRQRFDAGVSDNVDVVQSQTSVADTEAQYIDSVLAHNLAKLGLARAIGRASDDLAQFLKLP